jgi:hypothetical protein
MKVLASKRKDVQERKDDSDSAWEMDERMTEDEENFSPEEFEGYLKKEPVGLPEFREEMGLDHFLRQFRETARHYGWNRAEQLYYMKKSMRGSAEKLIWALNPKTLDELLSVLRTSYGNDMLIERNKVELQSRKRKDGETLQALFADIRSLLSDAYPALYGPVLEDLGKDAFLNALDWKLKNKVRERCPKTMAEALNYAMLFEGVGKAANQDREDDRKRHRTYRVEDTKEKEESDAEDTKYKEMKESYETLKADFRSLRSDYLVLKQNQEKMNSSGLERKDNEGWQRNKEQWNQQRQNPWQSTKSENGRPQFDRQRINFTQARRNDQHGGDDTIKCWRCGGMGHKSYNCKQESMDLTKGAAPKTKGSGQ